MPEPILPIKSLNHKTTKPLASKVKAARAAGVAGVPGFAHWFAT
jgi:hypothetical protein